MTNADRI